MAFPNAIVIGAPRSGTTSLYNYLKQHPQVYMSPLKETRFFAYEGTSVNYRGPTDPQTINRDTVTELDDFLRLFEGRSDEPVTGEASPIYLYRSQAPKRIHHYIPDAKLIAIFRNPIDRAYSDFLNMVRLGREPLYDFAEALRAEEQRIEQGWGPFYHYRSKGFYFEQVKRYTKLFDREQMKFYLYEDLNRDTDGLMKNIAQFLEIDDTHSLDTTTKHNKSGVPKSKFIHDLITNRYVSLLFPGNTLGKVRRRLKNINLSHEKPQLSPSVRNRLATAYREDILRLQDLIQRDLTSWIS